MSVVKEKKVVGAVELKEGTTIDILTSTQTRVEWPSVKLRF